MKHHVKVARDTLDALGFRLDHEDRKLRTDRWIYTHANEPDARLTLNYRMSEPATRTVIQRAKQIVGMATSEIGKARRRPKVNGRQKAERAAERRRQEESRSLAEARAQERQLQRAVSAASDRTQELDRLLRGGADDVDAGAVDGDQMLTVEQIADSTGLTDKVVQRAVTAGTLTAYQCGKQVKAKGRDVKAWLASIRGGVAR